MSKFKSDRAVIILAACLLAAPALAEEAQGAYISIELNAVEPVEDACRISFLVQNGHGYDIGQAVYEAVLFDTQGRVDRLTLFDFGALPAARSRVRQFVVPELGCASLGRLLINGVETCAGDNLPAGACSEGLALHSRTGVEVLG
ncbi:hypothetical protein AN191_03300 [Loktanella sp. 5RATIMAR09]|uniref:hypothetical protein n=1 Tax=Loktanella sp. 5RATIMAR09 TaxID=1225655 RepID=UPI0006EBD4EA|nr:hypothetical protein [Loktanella sp. 5RATIMAR09]KQI73293.1 hypothetical protein AN191_03300 [Loktanella sp. 5RATIMAR09]